MDFPLHTNYVVAYSLENQGTPHTRTSFAEAAREFVAGFRDSLGTSTRAVPSELTFRSGLRRYAYELREEPNAAQRIRGLISIEPTRRGILAITCMQKLASHANNKCMSVSEELLTIPPPQDVQKAVKHALRAGKFRPSVN